MGKRLALEIKIGARVAHRGREESAEEIGVNRYTITNVHALLARSVRRYKTVRDSLPEPDAFRLRYRSEIADVVRHAVREKIRPTEATLARLAKPMVSPEDLDRFTSIELTELHEGNIARFRLRPSEFKEWKEA